MRKLGLLLALVTAMGCGGDEVESMACAEEDYPSICTSAATTYDWCCLPSAAQREGEDACLLAEHLYVEGGEALCQAIEDEFETGCGGADWDDLCAADY